MYVHARPAPRHPRTHREAPGRLCHHESHGDEPVRPPTQESDEPHVDRSVLIGIGGRWLTDWALRLSIVLVAGWLLSQVGGALWVGILPILLAIIVATVLWPPTGWMVRHRVPASLASLISIVGALGIISGIIALIAPSIVEQSVQLADQTSEAIGEVQDWLRGPPLNIRDEQLDRVLNQLSSTLQDRGDQIATGVFTGVSAVGSFVVTLVLVLVLTFFFIKDGPRFLPFVRRTVGRNAGRHLTEVLTRCWNTLGGFVRTQAIVSFVDAFFIGLALVLLGSHWRGRWRSSRSWPASSRSSVRSPRARWPSSSPSWPTV